MSRSVSLKPASLKRRGESFEEVHAQLEANRTEGFDLVKAPVKTGKAGGMITTMGAYSRATKHSRARQRPYRY